MPSLFSHFTDQIINRLNEKIYFRLVCNKDNLNADITAAPLSGISYISYHA